MFLRNYWYVAAWSDEVGEKPLARTILGEAVALFRTPDGRAHALQDRCAHRRMPLSNGKVVGETLVCCYHGLVYAPSGECVRIPGQAKPPNGVRVRSFPAVERYGAVWLWMGDAAKADPKKVFRCVDVAEFGGGHPFYFHVKANYLLLNDNLSDLLHQAYLHNPSFGGGANPLGEFIPTVQQEGNRMVVRWDWANVAAPGAFAQAGQIDGPADGWNHSQYEPPSFYVNQPGFARAGTGGIASPLRQGAGKLSFTVNQLITPETERTTHFFKIVGCDWPPSMHAHLQRFIVDVNKEDIWACEEQQRVADRTPDAPMTAIPTDLPVVKMRQIVQRLLAEERGERAKESA
jgi:vanillate O-demethylase monooxygenase subunit